MTSPSLTRVLAVAASMPSPWTREALADALYKRHPTLYALDGFAQYVDTNRVWHVLVKLESRGLLTHDPTGWSVTPAGYRAVGVDVAALAAQLAARVQELTVQAIREREALLVQGCAWCGKRATTWDEDGEPSCRVCSSERATWAEIDARRAREARELRESEERR